MIRSLFLGLSFLALLPTPLTHAQVLGDNIVGVTPSGLGAYDGVGISNGEYLQVSWSATESYADVNIYAWLSGTYANNAFLPTTGTAYLTSASLEGPIEETFAFPESIQEVSLFSNLDLPSGTYFLTLASTSPYGGAWSSGLGGGNQDTFLDSGVTVNPPQYSNATGIDPLDPPTSSFNTLPFNQQVFYQVTTVTPEPPSIILVGTMSIGLILQFRRHKRSSYL